MRNFDQDDIIESISAETSPIGARASGLKNPGAADFDLDCFDLFVLGFASPLKHVRVFRALFFLILNKTAGRAQKGG